ncbi:MAG: hypothetical protein IJ521_11325 [Schwartzia sp.]|nr:hypothetical protein [Schwartzia sp. (in: firmicutes)]
MLMVLLGVVAVPLGLLFAWFLFLALVENLGPFVLVMLLLLKFVISCIVALVRYPFRPKDNASPA